MIDLNNVSFEFDSDLIITNNSNLFTRTKYDSLSNDATIAIKKCLDYFYEKMSREQRMICNNITSKISNEYDPSMNQIKPQIINAKAGSGKTYINLYLSLFTNVKFKKSNASLIFTPSYASIEAVKDKIDEFIEDSYDTESSYKTIKQYILNFLNIHTNNAFYSVGTKSFGIHNTETCSKVISYLKTPKYGYQKNNITY